MNQGSLVGRFVVAIGAVGVVALGQVLSASPPGRVAESRDGGADHRGVVATVTGAAGKSSETADLMAALRRGIEAGEIDPLTVVFTTDALFGDATNRTASDAGGVAAAPMRATAPVETAGGGVFINDDFSTYTPTSFTNPPTTLVAINGQVNPMGQMVGSASWVGVATDAIMMNIPSGAPGGMPPSVPPPGGEPYLALARRTGLSSPVPGFQLAMNYPFPALSPGIAGADHARVMTDWYLKDDSTMFISATVNNVAGVVQERVFFGGTQLSGDLAPFVSAGISATTLDTFVTLGAPALGLVGTLYAAPQSALVPFPVNQWFSIMTIVADDPSSPGNFGIGVFLKTQDSVAANVFLDPRLAFGDIIPVDKTPAGWVCIYPGFADDPITTGVREGIGPALDANSVPALTTGAFGLAPIVPQFPVRIDGLQVSTGGDPPAPFVPQDAFIDNKPIAGRFAGECPGDLNGDLTVDGSDLLVLLNGWGPCPVAPDPCPGDINGDGAVDGQDLLVLLNGFGAVCF